MSKKNKANRNLDRQAIQQQFKQVFDRFTADQAFRKIAESDPDQAFQAYPLLDPQQALAAIRYARYRKPLLEDGNIYWELFRQLNERAMQLIRDRQASLSYALEGIGDLASRDLARMQLSSPLFRWNTNVIYVPVAFELSSGCSVQCPFCGLAAPKLTGLFRYTPENARLWQEVLQACREFIGSMAGMGPCYFATEPFDNPDYEKFMLDHRRIFGFASQTTTATADRNPARIHAFMAWLGQDELQQNALRFSIYSLSQLNRILADYTPEELVSIELLANNPESDNRISRTGRCRENYKDAPKLTDYSISCLAGVWVSMSQRLMKWMEPEEPSADYPLGIRVLETRGFTDGDSFRKNLQEMIDHWAARGLPIDEKIGLHHKVWLERRGQLRIFHGEDIELKMGGNHSFGEAIDSLAEKPQSFSAMCRHLKIAEFPAAGIRQKLGILWQRGYICRI